MTTYVFRTTCILLALLQSTFSIKCIGNDGKDVDWWASLKPPQKGDDISKIVKNFYYFDANQPSGNV